MRPEAERHVMAGAALDVQLVGVFERPRVAVGRVTQCQHAFARPDQLPADLDVLDAQARRGRVDDRPVAQHLLDCVERLARVGLDRRELLRVAQERHRGQRNHVRRRLVPGHQQQEPGRGPLLPPVCAVRAEFDDLPAQQVVRRVLLLGRDEVSHVPADGVERRPPLFRRRRTLDQLRRVLLEEVVVAVRDPEHLADHQRRHRQRQRLHQVAGVRPGQQRVDPLVDDLLDPRPQRLHPAHGELAEHGLARRPVLGRVHGDHRALVALAPEPALDQLREVRVLPVGAEAPVVQHRADVVEPRDHPGLAAVRQPDPLDRGLLADLLVRRRRREGTRAGHRELVLLDGRHDVSLTRSRAGSTGRRWTSRA